MSLPLGAKAEKLRKEIKQMIPETAMEGKAMLEDTDRLTSADGRVLYSGAVLHNKVAELRKELRISDDVGFSVWHFTVGRPIFNGPSSMYIVPLSDKCRIIPGDPLTEGTCLHITDEPLLSPDSTFILFMK
ncbi:hypothetical protein V6Z77_009163 [Aspergillus fumigatus]